MLESVRPYDVGISKTDHVSAWMNCDARLSPVLNDSLVACRRDVDDSPSDSEHNDC